MYNALSFEQCTDVITGATVFLDVDGTLMPDNSLTATDVVLAKVKELAVNNRVLLCTNKRNPDRWAMLETLFGLPVITRRHKKPSRKVLDEAGGIGRSRVVIGDKYLTDGLFAKRIGARFLKVERKLSGRETVMTKAVNFFDDLLWNLTQKRFS